MAGTIAAQAQDFAHHFFAVIEEFGRENWVAANDAFERTVSAHPEHPYVDYLAGHRARRAGFAAAAEQVRQHAFPQIERRKVGVRKNAPVFYRIGRPGTGISLGLPHTAPAAHPLRVDVDKGNPTRRKIKKREARAPWRRRLEALRAAERRPIGAHQETGWRRSLSTLLQALSEPFSRPKG